MLDKLIGAEHGGNVKRLGHEAAFFNFKCSVHYFNFAAPLGLVAGHLYLGALFQLGIVLFGAGHVVKEVCAVLVLGINGSLVFPPGLLGLDVGFYNDLGIKLRRNILGMGHYAFALHICIGLIGGIVCAGGEAGREGNNQQDS